MQRQLEEELMTGVEQTEAYAYADFDEPHDIFVRLFRKNFGRQPSAQYVLELGCGAGDIMRRFAKAYNHCTVHGVDGSDNMLYYARKISAESPEWAQLDFFHGILPNIMMPRQKYDILICNSLLHHLHKPKVLWNSIKKYAKSQAPIFVMDLIRPQSQEAAKRMVEDFAVSEIEIFKQDFYNSLLAAFCVEEVKDQLAKAGLSQLTVEQVSDLHMLIHGVNR